MFWKSEDTLDASSGALFDDSREGIDANWPKLLVKMLVQHCQLGIGARVLDIGSGRGEVACTLNWLGIDATEVDATAENILLARQSAPQSEFRFLRSEGRLPSALHNVELILVRELSVFSSDLASTGAFWKTANLLSRLRPAGRLMFVLTGSERELEPRRSGHGAGCFTQLLSNFPGTCEVIDSADRFRGLGRWRDLLGFREPADYQFVALRTPGEPIAADQWYQFASRAARAPFRPCCPAGDSIESWQQEHRFVA